MTPLRPLTARAGLADAVADWLGSSDLLGSTRRLYGRSLNALIADVGAHCEVGQVGRAVIEEHLRSRYGRAAPATFNRNLAAIKSFYSWCVDVDLVVVSPAAKVKARRSRRTPEAERQARPIAFDELQALWSSPGHRLRERCYWAMLYDTAARANELLALDVEDLDLANKTAVVIGKGGDAERVHWSQPHRPPPTAPDRRATHRPAVRDRPAPDPGPGRRGPLPRHRPGSAVVPAGR